MRDHRWESDERAFDAVLESSLPEQPPADVVRGVTPWRRAMNRVLLGLALTTFTLELWGLQYILPSAGLLLMLLGLRSLRGENRWLKGCFVFTAARAACFWPQLALNATVYRSAVYGSAAYTALTALLTALTLLSCFCFWRGLQEVWRRAGLPGRAGGALPLLLWYAVLALLGLLRVGTDGWGPLAWVAAVPMLLAYAGIIRALRRLSRELEEAGYAIRPRPVRVSDGVAAGLVLGVLAAGIACGYLFFGSYPMDWQAAEPVTDGEAAEVRARLLDLGFPETVLRDLTEEELLACAGARKVLARTEELPVNEGRRVESVGADGVGEAKTVYDVKELRVTSVSVALPGERWRVFHHFLWTVDLGFHGTEALVLYPAYFQDGWTLAGELSGRLLYDLAGQSYTAGYHSIERTTCTGVYLDDPENMRVLAAFSLPREGTGKRGYLSYTVQAEENAGGNYFAEQYYFFYGWYVHQESWAQYPVFTAVECNRDPVWGKNAFRATEMWAMAVPRDEDAAGGA